MAKQKTVSKEKGYDLSKNFQFRPAGSSFGGSVHPWEVWIKNALPVVNKKGEEEQNPQFLRQGTPDEVEEGIAQYALDPNSPRADKPKLKADGFAQTLRIEAWKRGYEIQCQRHTMTVTDSDNQVEVIGVAYQCQTPTAERAEELKAEAKRRRTRTEKPAAATTNGDISNSEDNGDDPSES